MLSAVFAAATSILGKVGIEAVESNLGTAIRTGVVLILAWGLSLPRANSGRSGKLAKRAGSSLSCPVLQRVSWLFYYRALQNGQASIVVPIDKLSIVVTILFSRIVLKERLTGKAWAGFCHSDLRYSAPAGIEAAGVRLGRRGRAYALRAFCLSALFPAHGGFLP